MSNAVATTSYKNNGYNFEATYFASSPDSVIVVKLKTEDPNGINAILALDSQLPHSTIASNNRISTEGYAAYHSYPGYYDKIDSKHLYDPERGIRFNTILDVSCDDNSGSITSFPSGEIKIKGCKDIVITIANETSFNGFDKNPATEGKDYNAIVSRIINNATRQNYEDLLSSHIADYKQFFDRVSIDLGQTAPDIAALPTDEQLRLYTSEHQYNPDLEELYFQYGRYLLIASSRTPGVPANLQGLWNEQLLPPWSSNYTTNINLEENYWAACTANLSELQMPLINFISNLVKTGETSAEAYYGVNEGWCLGQNTDIWAMTCPVGLNSGDPSWACWTMGGTWLATHIWEHYMFTQDKEFLECHYPTLKGAALFCMNWLIEKDGHLITSPGTSPENLFLTPDGYAGATSYGSTADLAMIRECLIDTREAASVLGIDKDLRKKIDKTLEALLPYRIGKKGNLQEWYHDWEDQDPHHRHQSHLFGIYPGHHISMQETPELAKACARVLEMKGNETTGWSTGWRINIYARLLDGEKAYSTYRRLLKYISPDKYNGEDAIRGGGTYPNLLDAHSPFQIDGNFGGCAGAIEMLMQSTQSSITLLPALPEEWGNGKINGICARGGFVVNMEWENSKITSLLISSRNGGKTTLHFNGISKRIKLKAGEIKQIL